MILADDILTSLDFLSFYQSELGKIDKIKSNGWSEPITCPFHEDNNPSLGVNIKTGQFNCFGCGEKGSIFNFYMKKYNVNFKESLSKLAEFAGIKSSHYISNKNQNFSKKSFKELFDLFTKVDLPNEAIVYLQDKRKISKDIIRKLLEQNLIGWNEKAWYGHNNFRSAIVFPMFDSNNEVVGLQNIFINDSSKRFVSKSKLNKGFFIFGDINAEKTVITEAVIDALSIVQVYNNVRVIATYSANSLEKLQDIDIKSPILFFDNDQAGKQATSKVIEILKDVKVVKWESNLKDINQLIINNFGLTVINMINEAVKPKYTEYDREVAELNMQIDELNKIYSVTMIGGDTVVMNEFVDPSTEKKDIKFLSFQSFKNKFLNKKIIDPYRTKTSKKYRDIGSLWLESKRRREYEQCVFDPGNKCDTKKYFNLFRGFTVKPVKGSWEELRNHIFEVICNGDRNMYHWIMCWIARIIQAPGDERPGTAIVLKGEQGCGKGCFVNALGSLMFNHFLAVHQPKHLIGNFNSHLKDALLVFADEVTWGGDKQAEGILKSLITEPYFMVEQKNKDALRVKSHVNLIISSNNDWVIPAGLQERRFCTLSVQNTKVGNRRYFNKMFERMYKKGGLEAMMYDLLNYDISNVDLRTIPKTEELLQQIINTMHPVHRFWYDRLQFGSLNYYEESWVKMVEQAKLYEEYINFCDTVHISYKLPLNQFSRKLNEVCPEIKKIRPLYEGKQTPHYEIPDLETCRFIFEDIVDIKVSWDTNIYNN